MCIKGRGENLMQDIPMCLLTTIKT